MLKDINITPKNYQEVKAYAERLSKKVKDFENSDLITREIKDKFGLHRFPQFFENNKITISIDSYKGGFDEEFFSSNLIFTIMLSGKKELVYEFEINHRGEESCEFIVDKEYFKTGNIDIRQRLLLCIVAHLEDKYDVRCYHHSHELVYRLEYDKREDNECKLPRDYTHEQIKKIIDEKISMDVIGDDNYKLMKKIRSGWLRKFDKKYRDVDFGHVDKHAYKLFIFGECPLIIINDKYIDISDFDDAFTNNNYDFDIYMIICCLTAEIYKKVFLLNVRLEADEDQEYVKLVNKINKITEKDITEIIG